MLGLRGHPLMGAPAPGFEGATGWINHEPIRLDDLRGRVTLVEFWTYGCINCVRNLPFVQRWQDRLESDGLGVVGIHTPEFEHEKDPGRVGAAMRSLGVFFPVAADNERIIWSGYQNRYWPCGYLVDRSGIVRDVFVGEGGYTEREQRVRRLLAEAPGTA